MYHNYEKTVIPSLPAVGRKPKAGMSCQHCVASVQKALDAVEGVTSAEVAVGSARVTYDESRTDRDTITGAVHNAGYTIAG
jgi:copper chaperone